MYNSIIVTINIQQGTRPRLMCKTQAFQPLAETPPSLNNSPWNGIHPSPSRHRQSSARLDDQSSNVTDQPSSSAAGTNSKYSNPPSSLT